ncbi:MAG: twin-arginine translocase subunit TatC [Oscillospiraceae bacterium]|nr:twin-arginine translocase subunit TatC [Oscillospiraceae bacterium]
MKTKSKERKNKRKKAEAGSDGSMPLSGHLKELRNRILICVLVLFAGFGVCLGFAPKLVTALTDMGEAYDYVFVYIAPQELLLVYLNVALLGGVVLAFPVIAYHAYAFCSPGLRKRERFFTLAALVAGTLFFLVGVAFARFISLPFMLRFLIQFTFEVNVSASISIDQYVSFLLTVFVIFGLVFELPVISVLLTGLGLIKAEWLKKGRKVMIVLIFVLAAIITPPDVVSQIMVAVPMLALYELSIVLSMAVSRVRREKEAVEEGEEAAALP